MKKGKGIKNGHHIICKCPHCNVEIECFIPKKYEKKFTSININCSCKITYEICFEIELDDIKI